MARRSPQRYSPLASLAQSLGMPADATAWLEQALTHRSYTRERGDEEQESNERLEFLGDSVIQLVVSELLYRRYPRWSEGQLTRSRSSVVSREPLFRAAQRLNLGEHLRLGKTEVEAGGRSRVSILASAFEAVAASVYLTSGLTAAFQLVERYLAHELDSAESGAAPADFKTQYQEHSQACRRQTPVYRIVDTAGPDHNKTFRAEVLVDGEVKGMGEGHSKREAEQAAARDALDREPAGLLTGSMLNIDRASRE